MPEGGILVVAAHPDDETLGCGGTLALHADEGYRVSILCLTCSEAIRKKELLEASKVLGAEEPIIFEERRLIEDGESIRRISDGLVSKKPQIVFTHLPWDYHREHRLAHKLVREAIEWAAHTTTYSDPWRVERLLLMEVNTLIPTPHVNMDVSETIDRKLKALECYTSQISKFPEGYYQKLSKAKAELRGVQGGCRYAESFFEEPLTANSPFFREKSTRNLFE